MEVKGSVQLTSDKSETVIKESLRQSWLKWMLLLKSFMLELRVYWVWMVGFACFNGAVFVLFMWLLGAEGALFAITGSITMTLASNAALSLGQYIGGLKQMNAFAFYATLPISKLSFITALATRQLIFSLPSIVFLLIFGKLLFGLTLTFHPVLILIIILGGLSLVGVGALIGFYSPNGQFAGIATQVVQPIITFLGPVFVPYESLPFILQKTAILFPTTYIARALRAALTGGVGMRVYQDLGALLVWIVLSLVLVYPRLDWRGLE